LKYFITPVVNDPVPAIADLKNTPLAPKDVIVANVLPAVTAPIED